MVSGNKILNAYIDLYNEIDEVLGFEGSDELCFDAGDNEEEPINEDELHERDEVDIFHEIENDLHNDSVVAHQDEPIDRVEPLARNLFCDDSPERHLNQQPDLPPNRVHSNSEIQLSTILHEHNQNQLAHEVNPITMNQLYQPTLIDLTHSNATQIYAIQPNSYQSSFIEATYQPNHTHFTAYQPNLTQLTTFQPNQTQLTTYQPNHTQLTTYQPNQTQLRPPESNSQYLTNSEKTAMVKEIVVQIEKSKKATRYGA